MTKDLQHITHANFIQNKHRNICILHGWINIEVCVGDINDPNPHTIKSYDSQALSFSLSVIGFCSLIWI
jgi:hypothetical protein